MMYSCSESRFDSCSSTRTRTLQNLLATLTHRPIFAGFGDARRFTCRIAGQAAAIHNSSYSSSYSFSTCTRLHKVSEPPNNSKKLAVDRLYSGEEFIFEPSLEGIGSCKFVAKNSNSWDINEKMGIGGLDKKLSEVFRRILTSRILPPKLKEQLGMKHVRGMLLYGPPGTGKTLIARQLGKILKVRKPKIVNGPEIFDKYVGNSEANIRKLFDDAEKDWQSYGSDSELHMIIFDEIDAICHMRGSSSSSVNDKVVNQLLTKLDGVEQLENLLVIGTTNRLDLIDKALLRPGRMELQLEISLPDEHGRQQKFCSPENMIGYSVSEKCEYLRDTFDEACKSPLSCVIIDDLERLLDYSPFGNYCSNGVLQALLVLLGRRPPTNCRMLVLATASNERFLRNAELLDSFNSVISVPKLTASEHIVAVFKGTKAFDATEIKSFERRLKKETKFKISMGIKRLLELVDAAKQLDPTYQVNYIMESLLEAADQGGGPEA